MVVNDQGQHSQEKYHHLREKVSENIPVYQQNNTQPDVWATLNGKKDDFLIYDRCGRLVYHLGLPYSFLTFPYVEEAIRITYCASSCGNCSYMTPKIEEMCSNLMKAGEASTEAAAPPPERRKHHHRQGGVHGTGHVHRHQPQQNHQEHHRVSAVQTGSLRIVEVAPQQAVEAVPQEMRL